MVDILDQGTARVEGRQLTRRTINPRDPHCPMHLRRICGTCAAFPAGANMGAGNQQCSALQITVNGVRDASGCRRWARK